MPSARPPRRAPGPGARRSCPAGSRSRACLRDRHSVPDPGRTGPDGCPSHGGHSPAGRSPARNRARRSRRRRRRCTSGRHRGSACPPGHRAPPRSNAKARRSTGAVFRESGRTRAPGPPVGTDGQAGPHSRCSCARAASSRDRSRSASLLVERPKKRPYRSRISSAVSRSTSYQKRRRGSQILQRRPTL